MPRCVPHPSQSCRETGEFPQRLAEKTRRRREQLLVGRFLVKQRHAWRVCETLYYLLSSPRSFPRFLLFLILLLTRHFEKSLLLRLEQCGVVSHAEREAILLRLLHDFQDSLYSCSVRERVFAYTTLTHQSARTHTHTYTYTHINLCEYSRTHKETFVRVV